MVKVYEAGNEENWAEALGLEMADEFLPFVYLNYNQFMEDYADFDEPSTEDGISVHESIDNIPEGEKKVYTIVSSEDELVIPFLVKKGTTNKLRDADGVVAVSMPEGTNGVELKQKTFETEFEKEFQLTITKTDPSLEQEIEFLFKASDDDTTFDNSGEENDLVCGRIKIKFEKKKIKYEELKIKVLDCRTNDMIKNSKVNKIVLDGAYRITTDFNAEKFNKKSGKADDTDLVKQSQQALDGLGFDTNGPGTSYGDAGRTAYNEYWKSRFPKLVKDEVIEEVNEGNPPNEMLEFIIEEYNSNFSTDDSGLIHLKIPKYLLDEATELQIGLKDSPIVLEATANSKDTVVARSKDTTGGGTGFEITWGDGSGGTVEQSTEWGGKFGWQMSKDTMSDEFKVSLEIPIKEEKGKFTGFDQKLLSKFYKDENSAYHFVFYALQWCQPVWDGIEDPDPEAENPVRSNDYAFVNKKQDNRWVRGLNMHMTTRHAGSSGPYYGFCAPVSPFPRGRRHQGVDLHSGSSGNDSAFAVHGGELKKHFGSGYGRRAYLLFGGIGDPCFHYAHLEEEITEKDWVMAGEIVGTCGRTFNSGGTILVPDEYPSHLHLEFITSAASITPPITGTKVPFNEVVDITPPSDKTYSAPTGENAFLYQGNNLPLLLPCQCHYGSEQEVSQCRASDGAITNTCYAIARFPYENNHLLSTFSSMVSEEIHPTSGLIRYICPHILGEEADHKIQLQAKIKFLLVNRERFNPSIFPHTNDETTVFNSLITSNVEGMSIDGDIGNGTYRAIRDLIRAHYYCVNNDKKERILANEDNLISNEKILTFVNKYTDNTDIPSDDDHIYIRDFYDWFSDESKVNFNNMCWNNPQ